jgi:hypothetical protein
MAMAEDRDFLSRWSQRKADARDGRLDEGADVEIAALEPGEEVGTGGPAPQVGAEDGADPEEPAVPEELRGIDIDSLGYDADFTVFMKAGVPEALRRKALRRLWRTNPVLACLDGLNDYEEDFTDAAVAVKGLESAYRIGKGYLFAEPDETEGETEVAAADEVADDEADTPGAEDEVAEAEETLREDVTQGETDLANDDSEAGDSGEKT